jgi:DNA-directed RNA polymerase specialized sigma24 family protein
MKDSDEPQDDLGDQSGSYATVEEVATELSKLSQEDFDKLELQAAVLARGTGIEPGDLIHTVVERLLTPEGEHVRHWHKLETFRHCLYRTMKSIIRDYWRRQQIHMTAINDTAAGLRTDPDPEAQVVARQELQRVLQSLEDDLDTSNIALSVASGYAPAEVRERFGLTQTGYDSAMKRIRRKIAKYEASGDEQ